MRLNGTNMYETYLKNEREFEKNWEHGDIPNSFVTYKTDGSGYSYIDRKKIKSHNRLSLIKVMKALEKELEGDRDKIEKLDYDSDERGMRKGLQLSLDKIREFISKLEKGV